jgi:Protein of unknown function (DUF2924)
MELNIDREVAILKRQTTKQLRERYQDVFGEPTRAGNRTWLIRRIVWRLQALAQGDLSERARQRAQQLAHDADLRVIPPKDAPTPNQARSATTRQPLPTPTTPLDPRLPTPGTILTRAYKGEDVQVQVLKDGFEWNGEIFPSLSAVAKAITGSHCNGFAFFKLTGGSK